MPWYTGVTTIGPVAPAIVTGPAGPGAAGAGAAHIALADVDQGKRDAVAAELSALYPAVVITHAAGVITFTTQLRQGHHRVGSRATAGAP